MSASLATSLEALRSMPDQCRSKQEWTNLLASSHGDARAVNAIESMKLWGCLHHVTDDLYEVDLVALDRSVEEHRELCEAVQWYP